MANGSIVNNQGKKVSMYRTYTANGDLSSTQYLSPTKFKVGLLNGTPSTTNTALDSAIPITSGIVNDGGDNTLTGSSGGDNSTDNTMTFKQGAETTDVTAQNLIANGTNATKIWTIANLATLGTIMAGAKPFALWFYILDATALAKFAPAGGGTALTIKLGSDTSNYYSKTWQAADLAVGWNWISSGATNIEDLTETGTVAGDIDTFIIEVQTNNASDTFSAGDVIFDILRQWETTDLIKSFATSYPSFNYTNLEVTLRCHLTILEAQGFLINAVATFNEDTVPLMTSEDTLTGESKSNIDEFAFVQVDRYL